MEEYEKKDTEGEEKKNVLLSHAVYIINNWMKVYWPLWGLGMWLWLDILKNAVKYQFQCSPKWFRIIWFSLCLYNRTSLKQRG